MKMMKMLKLSCAAVIAMAPGAERRKARRCAKIAGKHVHCERIQLKGHSEHSFAKKANSVMLARIRRCQKLV